jgi:hypothetical protein
MVIKEDKLANIIKMLDADNKEDRVTALSVLEQNVKDNPIAILLAFKIGRKANWKEWEDETTQAWTYINKVKKTKANVALRLTFKDIFDHILRAKHSPDQMELFLKYFSQFLTNECLNLGYDFVQNINMEIKLKQE